MLQVAIHRHSTPMQRAWSEFFNWAHSPEVFLAGVDLAVFLHKDPGVPDRKELAGRSAILAWPRQGRTRGPSFSRAFVSVEELASKYSKKLRALSAEDDVVLARPTLPKPIRDALHRAGYYWEVPGEEYRNQRIGWQEETREAAETTRSQQPSHNGTLGLLPAPGKRIGEDECLLLVEVNYQWLVLSEVGLHGRTGGQKLLRGESIYFVTDKSEGWAIYELIPRHMVDRAAINAKWGGPAARRARSDAPSVVVTAKLIEPCLPR